MTHIIDEADIAAARLQTDAPAVPKVGDVVRVVETFANGEQVVLLANGRTLIVPPQPVVVAPSGSGVPAPPTQLPTGWALQQLMTFTANTFPSFLFNWGGGTPGGEAQWALWETDLAFVDANAILNLASKPGKIANGSTGVLSGGVGCRIGQTLPAGVMTCFKVPANVPNLSTVFPWWPDHGTWPVDQENDIYESGGVSTDENVRLHYDQRNLVKGPLHITWDFSAWTVMFVTWEEAQISVQLGHDVASCLASTPLVLSTGIALPTPQHFIDYQVEAVGPVQFIPVPCATQIGWFSLYEPA